MDPPALVMQLAHERNAVSDVSRELDCWLLQTEQNSFRADLEIQGRSCTSYKRLLQAHDLVEDATQAPDVSLQLQYS